MSYQILRIEKLTKIPNIKASAAHNFREMNVPNADSSRTQLNKTFGAQTGDELILKWESNIQSRSIKVRNKNTVKIVEFLITSSPEFFSSKKISNDYFYMAIQWLSKKFGRQNILSANLQLDETTPHLVVYVMPEVNGKLNAKHYFGGSVKMSDLQDDFYNNVGKAFNLERGLKGSKATHQKVKKIYGVANLPNIVLPSPPTKKIFGQYSPSEVDNYLTQTAKLAPIAKKLKLSELKIRELRSSKKLAEKTQQELEKNNKILAVIKNQNDNLMLRLSKFILNFDNNLKSQIAAKLNIQPDKPLIQQLQKGSLSSLKRYSFYDAIDAIMSEYETLSEEADRSKFDDDREFSRNVPRQKL